MKVSEIKVFFHHSNSVINTYRFGENGYSCWKGVINHEKSSKHYYFIFYIF